MAAVGRGARLALQSHSQSDRPPVLIPIRFSRNIEAATAAERIGAALAVIAP